jgi:hypothetical protein
VGVGVRMPIPHLHAHAYAMAVFVVFVLCLAGGWFVLVSAYFQKLSGFQVYGEFYMFGGDEGDLFFAVYIAAGV